MPPVREMETSDLIKARRETEESYNEAGTEEILRLADINEELLHRGLLEYNDASSTRAEHHFEETSRYSQYARILEDQELKQKQDALDEKWRRAHVLGRS